MSEDWDDMALVGWIARCHGHRGQVIVNPETDFPEQRFGIGRTVFTRRADRIEPFRITAFRMHQGRPVIGIAGVETMTEAEELSGLELRAPLDSLQALPEGTFYRHSLVGCVVRTTSGQEVGTVTAVEGGREGSRLVIAGGTSEILIPLVSAICVTIDPGAREIVIDPPDGLLEVNR